mgnify:CR=1 FL=1
MSEWISCKDRLPPRWKWIKLKSTMLFGNDYDIAKRIGIFSPGTWKYQSSIEGLMISPNDCWMPLPEAPKWNVSISKKQSSGWATLFGGVVGKKVELECGRCVNEQKLPRMRSTTRYGVGRDGIGKDFRVIWEVQGMLTWIRTKGDSTAKNYRTDNLEWMSGLA